MLKGHVAWTVKLFSNSSWLNEGVVIERLAVQHFVLLQRFLFPVFVQQHSAFFLVAVPIQQARQGNAGQSKHSSACTCMPHDAVPVGHICWLTQKGARQKKNDISLLIPGIQICTYGYVHIIPGTISRTRGSKLLLIQPSTKSLSPLRV